MGGERSQALMLTRVGQESEISVSGAAVTCDLTLLVVGGGGHHSSIYGGAGSGHLEYRSLQVSAGTVLTARVGDQGQASSLAISGGDTVTADPGQDGQYNDGGSGYCGGGGGGYPSAGGAGGSDGGDGEDGGYSGGRGSGQNVSGYTFTTWSLTPGAGGRAYHEIFRYYYGGGGGGLLLDGEGPPASQYQGHGYGGGGNGIAIASDGLPGLILLEVN